MTHRADQVATVGRCTKMADTGQWSEPIISGKWYES